MVMDNSQSPTAACVGVELVRQYYTMLNKAPLFLHRFYSNESLLTHGTTNGRNEIIQGQSQIHQKVLSMGFTECHAKIKKITCQMTFADGVVVQVAGELSNDGAPLRQFMQTFVLVPQSVKKYYVHNDIFHYLDEVFKDDNNVDEGVSSGAEEDLEPQTTSVSEGFNIAPTLNGTPQADIPIMSSPSQSPMVSPIVPQQPTQAVPPQPPSPAPVVAPKEPTPPKRVTPTPVQPTEPTQSPPAKWVKPQEPKANLPAVSPTPPKPAAPTEPKTYANLFKNQSSRPFNVSATPRQVTPPPEKNPPPKAAAAAAPAKPSPPTKEQKTPTLTNGSGPTNPTRPSKFFQGNSRFSHSDDQEKRSLLPDSHQVFVGNLHQSVTEDVLKEKFSTFGKVTEMRINTAKGKTLTKGTGHPVPNFGFVGFDSKEAVERCLQARPIYLKGDRINVEEKKARSSRMPDDRTGPTRGAGRGGPSSRGGSRGGRGFTRTDSSREGYTPRR